MNSGRLDHLKIGAGGERHQPLFAHERRGLFQRLARLRPGTSPGVACCLAMSSSACLTVLGAASLAHLSRERLQLRFGFAQQLLRRLAGVQHELEFLRVVLLAQPPVAGLLGESVLEKRAEVAQRGESRFGGAVVVGLLTDREPRRAGSCRSARCCRRFLPARPIPDFGSVYQLRSWPARTAPASFPGAWRSAENASPWVRSSACRD